MPATIFALSDCLTPQILNDGHKMSFMIINLINCLLKVSADFVFIYCYNLVTCISYLLPMGFAATATTTNYDR